MTILLTGGATLELTPEEEANPDFQLGIQLAENLKRNGEMPPYDKLPEVAKIGFWVRYGEHREHVGRSKKAAEKAFGRS